MIPIFVIPFDSSAATLARAGGKGLNLARLTRAGFPVPRGFIVPTDAYWSFVAANALTDGIAAAIAGLAPGDAAPLEAASNQIQVAFTAGKMPAETESAIRAAYAGLKDIPVAVRSSATAEDLPDLSFAGQQDTYLNIIGTDELLKAVIACWASLWTARAIGYRLRNQIAQDQAALAVVVQEMVQSESSGVLFSANPLTGLRSEAVIDATLGLGEALVSGQVEPDHYVVNTLSGEIVSKTLGEKKISTRGKTGGGVETVPENAEARQALTDAEIRQLAALGQDVQKEYGFPQDIEWAFADGKLYLLQARAITSLFPIPETDRDSSLRIWFSFGAVQGMLRPITPLGRDAIRNIMGGMAKRLGSNALPEELDTFGAAGERIWIKISDVLRHPVGQRVMKVFMGFIEPSSAQIVLGLASEPRIRAGTGRIKLSTLHRLSGVVLPILANAIRNVLAPVSARARFDADIASYLSKAQIAPAADRFGRLANVAQFMREGIGGVFPFLLPKFIAMFGPIMAALNLLNEIAGENRALALEVTRGLPDNVTTQMDLHLWETASAIRADAESASLFRASDAPALAHRYLDGSLPAAAQAALARFLDQYGMRGIAEIDFGQPRWREEPTDVMRTLQSYLQIDPSVAPDVMFAKGAAAAQDAIEKLAALARQQPGGWMKEKVVRGAARRVRMLMGARESPKFFAIRIMGIARKALLEVGQEFVEAGTLTQADDLVFLQLAELEALSRSADESTPKNWPTLIAERRALYERETRRRQVPRILVSDGRAFYEGMGAATDSASVISGSPVSPGVVEGIVHIVFSPNESQLAPGEILVCPGTDPAWTPLFLTAGGLITEVGGMMTHGSVVAREYGIPAVVGVHQATERFKTGQKIRLDGTTGKIVVLE